MFGNFCWQNTWQNVWPNVWPNILPNIWPMVFTPRGALTQGPPPNAFNLHLPFKVDANPVLPVNLCTAKDVYAPSPAACDDRTEENIIKTTGPAVNQIFPTWALRYHYKDPS